MVRPRLPVFVLLTPLFCPTPLMGQGTGSSPGDIILQAIRSAETQDSTLVLEWQRTVTSVGPDSEPPRNVHARRATLGLAATAWVTYRHADADEWLDGLLDPGGPTDDITPYAWILRGEVASSQAKLLRADSAFARAVEVSEDLSDRRSEAWSLIRLANVRGRTTGNPEVSRELLTRAEALLEPGDGFLRSQFHCVRAGNEGTGTWTAEADARAGMDLARHAGIERLYAACLHVLASDQLRKGKTNEALATFWQEQEVQRSVGDRAGRAATLQWAGYLLFASGDFASAKAYLLEAVREGEASGNLSPVAWAYLSLSGIAVGLGDLKGGTEYLNRAEALLEAQGDRLGLSTLQGRRASLAVALGEWDSARVTWEETLRAHQASGNVLGVLSTLTGLLELALASGDLQRSEELLARARETARKADMGAWEVSFFFHEAEIALKEGDPARARTALDRFLLPGQFSVRNYRAQVRYAEALVVEGRISEAAERLERAFAALEEWRSGLDAAGLQRYAFQIGEYLPDPDLGVASVLAALARSGETRRAFNLAERQRARVLYERMILAEIDRTREVREPRTKEALPLAPDPADAGRVLAALPDGSVAIVEFVTGRGGEPTTAFVLASDRVQAATLPPVDSLQRDISLLRSLAESGGGFRPLAGRLGKELMEPVVDLLPRSVSTLVLVPSGPLHRIPFDLLETGADGPLVGRYDLSLVPSASVAHRLWQSKGAPSSALLVMAAPSVGGGDTSFAELPGASREARMVAGFGRPTWMRVGKDATEAFLKETPLEGLGVLHFATHAVVDEASVAGSRLVLAPGNGEDGLVSPGDIARMQLGASLVVLSVCRGAGGAVVRGEGVQGLTASFLQAGARAVVATQWPVDDRAGLRLIRGFYRRLAEGSSVGQALEDAKEAAMSRGEPVSSWGAFTVVGDSGLRVPLVRPAWWRSAWTWASGLSPILLAAG
ncbi:MAG: CHAT domain-containing protein, partial [Gemmatimonadota bacterium]